MSRGGRYIDYIHSCRVIAIVIIVAGHCISPLDWRQQPRTAELLGDLLANGTVVFVFLSGFLFAHLSDRYSYPGYLRKKLANVWIPYLLISIPAIVYAIGFSNIAAVNPWLASRPVARQVVFYYMTGGAHIDFPLWFVPMITVFFVAAPLFIALVRRPRLCNWLVLPLIAYSALAHRPRSPNLETLYLAAYFLGPYVLGIWASQHRAWVEKATLGTWPWLLAAFAVAVVAQFWLSPFHGNYEGKAPFSMEHGLIDWTLLQKALLCFVLIALTQRFQRHLTQARYLGDISFPIFLVHGYFVSWGELSWHTKPQGSLWMYAVYFVAVLAASTAFVYLCKLLLGKRSHYLLGA